MNQKVKVGIIGFGRMGGFYLEEMRKSDQWEVLYICDTDPEARDLARRKSPTSRIVADEQVVFEDPEVQVVGLFTLADSRLRQIKKAMAFGKHVISEKPVADTIEHEWEVVNAWKTQVCSRPLICICVILGTIIRLKNLSGEERSEIWRSFAFAI